MATTRQVAQWMLQQLNREHMLPVRYAAEEIHKQFGPAFVYQDGSGLCAISEDVLQEFRRLSAGVAVWNASRRYWLIEDNNQSPALQASGENPNETPVLDR